MPSSNKSEIAKRTLQFLESEHFFSTPGINGDHISRLGAFLQAEYDCIPEKERVGKGAIYISTAVARATMQYWQSIKKGHVLDLAHRVLAFSQAASRAGEAGMNRIIPHFSIIFMAESVALTPLAWSLVEEQALEWASSKTWELRETSIYPFIEGIKHYPEILFPKLEAWAKSSNPNIRRVVAESLRPRAEIIWLRNPDKNDHVLEILSLMRQDPAEYVRKSVGNNLKDLTKYMPEKILSLAESWVEAARINVSLDIVSRSKKDLGDENYYLIWTLKQAMRWIQARNPEFHSRIAGILGSNYIKYYEEKKNKMARPGKKTEILEDDSDD